MMISRVLKNSIWTTNTTLESYFKRLWDRFLKQSIEILFKEVMNVQSFVTMQNTNLASINQ
jgi:hypothetical protein